MIAVPTTRKSNTIISHLKFPLESKVLIMPNTLGLYAGNVYSRSSSGFSVELGNRWSKTSISFELQEKEVESYEQKFHVGFLVPTGVDFNTLDLGYERVQEMDFIRLPGLSDKQFFQDTVDELINTTNYIDFGDSKIEDTLLYKKLSELKDFEQASFSRAANNYLGLMRKSILVLQVRNQSYLIENSVMWDNNPRSPGYGAFEEAKGLNIDTKNYVDSRTQGL